MIISSVDKQVILDTMAPYIKQKAHQKYVNDSEYRAQQLTKSHAWIANNLERFRAVKKTYYDIPENKANKAKTDRIRYLANPDKMKQQTRAWITAHPAKKKEYRQRSKAKRRNTPGAGVTATQWEVVLANANGQCCYCGAATDALTMDHIIPIRRGGLHEIGNVAAACMSCNSSKGKKILYEEWIPPLKK